MRWWWLALLLCAACEFPARSVYFACETTADCDNGRTCDEQGYCVVSADAGTRDDGTSASDAAINDATVAPDANLLPMQCQAAGYTHVPGPNGYYRVMTNGQSWLDAQAACKSHLAGATHLIVLSTPAEVTYMASQLGWVGLSDRTTENQFATVTGETGDQRPWESGQPDNGSGSEDCVHMISGGALNDDQCDNGKRFVCECDGKMSTP